MQPMFEKLISVIPVKIYKSLTVWVAVFMIINIVISAAAVMRWGMRPDGIPAGSAVRSILDTLFPNEFMTKVYPKMMW